MNTIGGSSGKDPKHASIYQSVIYLRSKVEDLKDLSVRISGKPKENRLEELPKNSCSSTYAEGFLYAEGSLEDVLTNTTRRINDCCEEIGNIIEEISLKLF